MAHPEIDGDSGVEKDGEDHDTLGPPTVLALVLDVGDDCRQRYIHPSSELYTPCMVKTPLRVSFA